MHDLSVHRYRELKHFCLQYPEMKEQLAKLEAQLYLDSFDPTGDIAVKINEYKNAIKLIEMTAFNIGNFPGEKILKIVSNDRCLGELCPDEDLTIVKFYLRKFFWMLSDVKGM